MTRRRILDGHWELQLTYRLFRDERVAIERRLWHTEKMTYRDSWRSGTPDRGLAGPLGALITTISGTYLDPLMPALGALTAAALRLPPPAPNAATNLRLHVDVRGSTLEVISGAIDTFDPYRGSVFGLDWRGSDPELADSHPVTTDRSLIALTDQLYAEMTSFIRAQTEGLPVQVELAR